MWRTFQVDKKHVPPGGGQSDLMLMGQATVSFSTLVSDS